MLCLYAKCLLSILVVVLSLILVLNILFSGSMPPRRAPRQNPPSEEDENVPSDWTNAMEQFFQRFSTSMVPEINYDRAPLDIVEFDVILGMDFLEAHRAMIDCFRKIVVLRSPGKPEVTFHGERYVVSSCLISAVTARKLLNKGCQAYLAHVVDTRKGEVRMEDIPVVNEFPDELPGLPPVREIDFSIELLLGTMRSHMHLTE